MYSVGEKIMYGSLGLMEIVDITDQTVGDVTRRYYVVKELASPSSSLTYVPLDSEELVSQMKPLLSKEEILDTVKRAKALPPLEWVEENRARSDLHKKILSSGDRVKLLVMIDSIRDTGKRRVLEGKKNYISDENFMKRAEKIVYSEFAMVLGIDESEVSEFIENI